MILDKQLILSNGQAVTSSATSTNVIDMGAAGDATDELYLNIIVSADCTAAGGAGTVAFDLLTDSVEALSSPTKLWSKAATAQATLVDGYVVTCMRLPKGCERYLGVLYTVASGPLVAGSFYAFLSKGAERRS